jgi:anti-anti-sigma factor
MAADALPIRLDVQTEADALVLRVAGNQLFLDDQSSACLREQLTDRAAAPGVGNLIVDFRNVAAICSTTLGALLAADKAVRAAGKRLILRNLGDPVYEVLAITRLHTYFQIDQQEAK